MIQNTLVLIGYTAISLGVPEQIGAYARMLAKIDHNPDELVHLAMEQQLPKVVELIDR